MWFLDGRLDPISGAVVAEALRRAETELFDADWAAARRPMATPPPARISAGRQRSAGRTRSSSSPRRASATPSGARRPQPLFTVLVGYETFAGRICELADGTVVTPGSLTAWLGDAWVERVVFDGPGRVTDVGPRRRLFTGATRRAVQVRDRECFHEFCDTPAELAEVDHVQPSAAGGLTVTDNGRPACGYHNRWRHRSQPP
jgi:hypothetical protein